MEPDPNTLSLSFVEGLYQQFLTDPGGLPLEWQRYFAEQDGDASFAQEPRLGPTFKPASLFGNTPSPSNGAHGAVVPNGNGAHDKSSPVNGSNGSLAPSGVSQALVRQDQVDALIRAYRVRGHMMASIDPLGLPRPSQPELDPAFHGLMPADLDRKFSSRTIF